MKKCMFCNESNHDLMEEHHTVPKKINQNWTKTVSICLKCHKILHMYFLEDILNIIEQIKHHHMLEHNILTENGIINYKFDETELHKEVINFLYHSIPKRFEKNKKHISYKTVVENIDFPEKNNRKNGQVLGYIIKDLGLDKRRLHGGNIVSYTPRTISLLKRYKKS